MRAFASHRICCLTISRYCVKRVWSLPGERAKLSDTSLRAELRQTRGESILVAAALRSGVEHE